MSPTVVISVAAGVILGNYLQLFVQIAINRIQGWREQRNVREFRKAVQKINSMPSIFGRPS